PGLPATAAIHVCGLRLGALFRGLRCRDRQVGDRSGTARTTPRGARHRPTSAQALLLVVYPQALRMVTPSLASICSQLIKDSSLASVITVAELTYQASAIEGQTFRTFEVYITISLLYLLMVTIVTYGLLLVPGARDDLEQRVSDA